METILFTFGILLLSICGLAIGTMFGRAPVAGSCGGISCIKGVDCGACKARSRDRSNA